LAEGGAGQPYGLEDFHLEAQQKWNSGNTPDHGCETPGFSKWLSANC
jgi:hypothetical protein